MARRTVVRSLTGCGAAALLWLTGAVAALSDTAKPADATQEEEVVVNIRLRQFEPATVLLHSGRKTKLVLHNLDAELHAFVPVKLFAGVNLNISGNGAPEFSDDGLKRVIIPPEGRTEIRFIPSQAGTFPFTCDMPGHQMQAAIVVQD
jgi:uncharacterized cupredoxin-like copper-binding protein